MAKKYNELTPGEKAVYRQAMAKIESTSFNAVAMFSDVFQDYLQSCVDEHNKYLQQKNRQHGIDLSRLVLFRA